MKKMHKLKRVLNTLNKIGGYKVVILDGFYLSSTDQYGVVRKSTSISFHINQEMDTEFKMVLKDKIGNESDVHYNNLFINKFKPLVDEILNNKSTLVINTNIGCDSSFNIISDLLNNYKRIKNGLFIITNDRVNTESNLTNFGILNDDIIELIKHNNIISLQDINATNKKYDTKSFILDDLNNDNNLVEENKTKEIKEILNMEIV